jgi:serine protease AprX
MRRILCLISLLILVFSDVQAQKYWVFFTNKKDVSFNPYEYFDEKAIERRQNLGISLYDSTDYAVNQNYVQEIFSNVDTILTQSRWFNAVSVIAQESQIQKISDFPFVKKVEKIEAIPVLADYYAKDYDTSALADLTDMLEGQLEIMGGDVFKENGIDGKGIRIAIFDGGFPAVNTSPVFQDIREDGRIIKTWDFAKNREFVYSYSAHGTMVLSCIAGRINGVNLGMATGAEFLLARTEINREPFSEEENWLAAMEWADKNGADIINSSLGYTYHRYFPEQMDGKYTFVSRAANMAAAKGILVCNAAGNDGSGRWKYIGAPADADSILSVGGIDPDSKIHINFSSFGPTADKRMKPNVCAYGHAVVAGKKKITTAFGTSFASPLVAGFVACAWQTNKELTNMQLFDEVQKSAHLYPYYDYAHGYGVPQALYFIDGKQEVLESFSLRKNGNKLQIVLTEEPSGQEFPYFYYNIMDKNGFLEKYQVIEAYKRQALEINLDNIEKGKILNFYYQGYYLKYEIK